MISVTRLALSFEADTPRRSKVRFEVRGSPTLEGVDHAPWEPLGEGGEFPWNSANHWLQYRAVLVAGRGYASPYLTKVVIREPAR